MTADDSREILRSRQESNLIVKGSNFLIALVHSVAISLHFLCPRDQQSEICGLRQLCQFRRLRTRQNASLQANRLEVLSGILAICRIDCSHELGVRPELFAHSHVFAANRAVRYGSSAPSRDRSRCSYSHSAVDDRQYRPEQFNVTDCFADEVLNLERKAHMQNINRTN